MYERIALEFTDANKNENNKIMLLRMHVLRQFKILLWYNRGWVNFFKDFLDKLIKIPL